MRTAVLCGLVLLACMCWGQDGIPTPPATNPGPGTYSMQITWDDAPGSTNLGVIVAWDTVMTARRNLQAVHMDRSPWISQLPADKVVYISAAYTNAWGDIGWWSEFLVCSNVVMPAPLRVRRAQAPVVINITVEP